MQEEVRVCRADDVPDGGMKAYVVGGARLAGIGAFPTLLQGSLLECVTTSQTAADVRSAAEAFASTLG
ncbi:MAG: hypothetical protein K6T30_08845, partial [Alicyclobacillus sp.]|nr:hypothetical protein [Alicyclobacillus sp.]